MVSITQQYWVTWGSNCIIVPNCTAIGQTVAEISLLLDFSRWRPPPSWLIKFLIFNDRTALLCQISLKSLVPWQRYGDFSICRNGDRRHLGFLKLQIFNGRTCHECRTVPNFLVIGQTFAEISRFCIFQYVGRRHLRFLNFKFLTVGTVKKVQLRHYVKFCRNRLNRSWDMVLFDFSKMAAVRRLGFVMHVYGPPTKGIWWSLSLCKIRLESMQFCSVL